MIGVCIELKTTCKHCSTPLMLNAFTEDILCSSCNKVNSFSVETWHSLLEDGMKKAPKFKLGEGQPSTIFRGEYNYSLMYGRQEPRCSQCKEGIDLSKIEEYSSQKKIKCSKCSNIIFIRKPSEFVTNAFTGIKYLAGEDDDLISSHKPDDKLPNSAKPVLFTCPSCAGNLEIDGSERIVTCKYCDSQIYLPDDLWLRLHPAKTIERWYLLYDDEEVSHNTLPEWYYLSDITIDREGNLYITSSVETSEDDFIVWSIGPDMKTRWVRKGLKFSYEKTGLTLTSDGNLYLWNKQKHSLLKLSSKDGSTMQKIQGKPVSKDDPYAFNLKGCSSMISDTDGTILALINNTVVRYSANGERIPLWTGKKFGLFSTGLGEAVPQEDIEWAPYIKEIKSFPKRVNSEFTKLSMSWEGGLYMMDKSSSEGEVAKYDKDGTRLWSKYIPLEYKDCKPCFDAEGNVYVLGTNEHSNTNLVRLNQRDHKFETLLTDLKEGGVLDEEDQLAVAPDGTIYIMKSYDSLKVFSADLKMIYRTKQSEEDDNDVLEKKKKSIEKDEEFS